MKNREKNEWSKQKIPRKVSKLLISFQFWSKFGVLRVEFFAEKYLSSKPQSCYITQGANSLSSSTLISLSFFSFLFRDFHRYDFVWVLIVLPIFAFAKKYNLWQLHRVYEWICECAYVKAPPFFNSFSEFQICAYYGIIN